MGNILVTGGAGYIGQFAARELASRGYNPIIFDRKDASGELNDPASIARALERNKIGAVMHFAASIEVGESMADPQKYYINNVAGTLNLLKAMRDAGVMKLVFSSSAATFGLPQYTPMDEAHPQNPINTYGYTKLIMERMCADFRRAYGLSYIAFRYFNASGAAADGSMGEAHDPETHIIPLILKTIKGEREKFTIFGRDYDTPDGTCVRDYIHVEDLAAAHRLALEHLDEFSGGLNLSTGRGHSNLEILRKCEETTGKKCPFEWGERRPGDPDILVSDNKKAMEVLGWKPSRGIDDIIKSAWKWEKSKK
ncbi:MAG: UDP-glucose 4-epimerase GalE [Rickettsiales bacterium]|jgi:UDP-glucose 4-epimerase|nr:UDP-glucose 4-epimerase GalE [Rickettsiales bacterium]